MQHTTNAVTHHGESEDVCEGRLRIVERVVTEREKVQGKVKAK